MGAVLPESGEVAARTAFAIWSEWTCSGGSGHLALAANDNGGREKLARLVGRWNEDGGKYPVLPTHPCSHTFLKSGLLISDPFCFQTFKLDPFCI
jgi:hypothetical protein